ncbi:MAG: zinc-dependent peptidase [Bacteroidetes bacterium]|nr:zinc-dependent peptidase [Bacteroidota bacterium]
MPPPDTLLHPYSSAIPLQPDSVFSSRFLDSVLQAIHPLSDPGTQGIRRSMLDQPRFIMAEWQMFGVVAIIIFLLFFMALIWPKLMARYTNKKIRHIVQEDLGHYHSQYDDWLCRFNPYYASLSPELKERFLHRTITFLHTKEFRFHSLSYEPYIPLLISGAAVQITFGLKNYLLDFFPVIHVIRKEYVLHMDKETYYGHVSPSGIYIAWNHFLDGYADYADAINVGLHEMAHAVSFDVFLGQCDHHDHAFRSRLEEFSEEGRPVFRAMRSGMSHLLDDYGATNFDEFWAVCVETFFEAPDTFKSQMPDLYLSIAELLNQDPLHAGHILDPELAGLA